MSSAARAPRAGGFAARLRSPASGRTAGVEEPPSTRREPRNQGGERVSGKTPDHRDYQPFTGRRATLRQVASAVKPDSFDHQVGSSPYVRSSVHRRVGGVAVRDRVPPRSTRRACARPRGDGAHHGARRGGHLGLVAADRSRPAASGRAPGGPRAYHDPWRAAATTSTRLRASLSRGAASTPTAPRPGRPRSSRMAGGSTDGWTWTWARGSTTIVCARPTRASATWTCGPARWWAAWPADTRWRRGMPLASLAQGSARRTCTPEHAGISIRAEAPARPMPERAWSYEAAEGGARSAWGPWLLPHGGATSRRLADPMGA